MQELKKRRLLKEFYGNISDAKNGPISGNSTMIDSLADKLLL